MEPSLYQGRFITYRSRLQDAMIIVSWASNSFRLAKKVEHEITLHNSGGISIVIIYLDSTSEMRWNLI